MSSDSKCNLYTSSTGNCAYGENKLTELLKTAKSVYTRLDKDVCQYVFELGKLQDYFQKFNLEDEIMFEAMVRRYNQLSEYLFVTLANHLSITTHVEGVGEKVIRPVTGKTYTTTLKYQNVFKKCTGCNECMKGVLATRASNKYYGASDVIRVQYSKNVATYDNMSIHKNYNGSNIIGYTIKLGDLQYIIKNGNSLPIKKNECISQKNIADLFKMIDTETTNLGDIQRMIRSNINFIDKYISKFVKIHSQ
jgi:hypothetical protein